MNLRQQVEEKVDFLKLLLSNPKLDDLNIEYDLKKPFQNIVNLNESKKWWPEIDAFLTSCVDYKVILRFKTIVLQNLINKD